jgi:hypothetical protein
MSQTRTDNATNICTDKCCAPPALVLPPRSPDREALFRDAFKLEWLTIGWMSVEARRDAYGPRGCVAHHDKA